MASCTRITESMGYKLYTYLEQFPHHYDITFAVGTEKVLVKALSIILRASSPVFEKEFKDRWDEAVVKEGEGIMLPELDPAAFKLFLKLMILDTWSVDALKALKLPPNQLLHLLAICRKYEITNAIQSLEELVSEILKNFHTYATTQDFLLLSQPQLETVLSSDDLQIKELHVFNYARRWAEEQCRKQDLEVTGSNLRQVLGKVLYEIRMPLLSITEFSAVLKLKGLLNLDEVTEIVELIGMGENGRMDSVSTDLKFSMDRRNVSPIPDGSSIVSVAQAFPVIDTPFVCDGKGKGSQRFNMNFKIALCGVSFLGPIVADAFYDVTVTFGKYCVSTGGFKNVTEKMEQKLFAKKSSKFIFIFDQPIALDPIPYDNWKNFYYFYFTLKGPDTRSLQSCFEAASIYDTNKEFVIGWNHSQLVEIIYKAL